MDMKTELSCQLRELRERRAMVREKLDPRLPFFKKAGQSERQALYDEDADLTSRIHDLMSAVGQPTVKKVVYR